jgi:rhodanese-related sulfurtransferase
MHKYTVMNMQLLRSNVVRSLAIAATIVIFGISGVTYFWLTRAPTWGLVDSLTVLRYSDVDSISTEELATLLKQDNASEKKVWLLDIREASEYAVSRIPGAKHVAPSSVIEFAEREMALLNRTQPIVVYCAVGVRSASAASDLMAVGFTNVRNVRGSIFKWANENRALEGGTLVHPYDGYWGQLLNKKSHWESEAK